jgi:hypothetical protein
MAKEQRDQLVHERVMGHSPNEPCTGEFAPNPHDNQETLYCPKCGACIFWEESKKHKPLSPPAYTSDMNAAWDVVRMVNNPNNPEVHPNYQTYRQFINHLQEIVGSDLFFDLFYCDHKGDYLTPERICIAALKACGVEVEVK